MKVINLKERNLVWWFYCRSFELSGLKVEQPKNLCRFCWIAFFGFLSWMLEVVKIRYIWLTAAALTGLWFGLVGLYSIEGNILLRILYLLVLPFWVGSVAFSMVIPAIRIYKFVNNKAPLIIGFVVGGLVFAGLAVLIIDSEMRSEFFSIYGGYFWVFFVGGILIIIAVPVCMLVLPYLAGLVPDRFVDGGKGVFRTIIAYLKAKKEGVCPGVNPPDSSKE